MSNMNTEKLNKALYNPTTKNPYTLSEANLPKAGAWATLFQWRKAGYSVRKGEHGTRVEWTDANGNPRAYTAFHASQCDALDTPEARKTAKRIAELAKLAEKAKEPEKPKPEIIEEQVDTNRVAELVSKYSLSEIQTAYAEIQARYAKLAQQAAPEIPEKPEPKSEPEIIELKPTLKKGGFFITGRFPGNKSTLWVDGYTFAWEGMEFGVYKHHDKYWNLTELSTGLSAGTYNSRKAAVEALTPELFATIRKSMEHNEKFKKPIADAYAERKDAAQGGR